MYHKQLLQPRPSDMLRAAALEASALAEEVIEHADYHDEYMGPE